LHSELIARRLNSDGDDCAGARGYFIRRASFRAAFFARLGLALATARFTVAFSRALPDFSRAFNS